MDRNSFSSSVLIGMTLGAVTGAFLASLLAIVGQALVIWNSFEGGRPDGFRWMIVPMSAGIFLGGAVGGAIGLMHARRRERRRSATTADPPARPDLP